MDPNAHLLHMHMHRRCSCEQPGCDMEHGAGDSAMPGIVETSSDQTWTEFCASLNRNAFLLADSGLEQA